MTAAEATLLRIGFRNRVVAPNVEAGFEEFSRLSDGVLTGPDFHAAVARCLSLGLIRDPVRLSEGALQCHWHFELTPAGVEVAGGYR